jgi:D-aminopeptidase
MPPSPASHRALDLGIGIGVLRPGPLNAITDVSGVAVGHITLHDGDAVCTGVTAILPHAGNLFQDKVPAGFAVGNGFGKFAGSTQVAELGEIETPPAPWNGRSRSTATSVSSRSTLWSARPTMAT